MGFPKVSSNELFMKNCENLQDIEIIKNLNYLELSVEKKLLRSVPSPLGPAVTAGNGIGILLICSQKVIDICL